MSYLDGINYGYDQFSSTHIMPYSRAYSYCKTTDKKMMRNRDYHRGYYGGGYYGGAFGSKINNNIPPHHLDLTNLQVEVEQQANKMDKIRDELKQLREKQEKDFERNRNNMIKKTGTDMIHYMDGFTGGFTNLTSGNTFIILMIFLFIIIIVIQFAMWSQMKVLIKLLEKSNLGNSSKT